MSFQRITFVTAEGTKYPVEAPVGWTLMEAAVKNAVPGIVAECGGSCACATCHLFVASEWSGALPAPESVERDMLECTAEPATAHSRLGCQVRVTAQLDGIVIHLPQSQV